RLCEVSDVVVGKVADRPPIGPARATRVLGDRHAELDTPLPERLIVVRAVERDVVAVPGGPLRIAAFGRRWNRALLVAAEHDRLEAPLADRVVELVERLVGRVGGKDRDRGKV